MKGAMIEILISVYKTTVLDPAVIRDFGANVVSVILAELSNMSRTVSIFHPIHIGGIIVSVFTLSAVDREIKLSWVNPQTIKLVFC